jgi:hypothetical protein
MTGSVVASWDGYAPPRKSVQQAASLLMLSPDLKLFRNATTGWQSAVRFFVQGSSGVRTFDLAKLICYFSTSESR